MQTGHVSHRNITAHPRKMAGAQVSKPESVSLLNAQGLRVFTVSESVSTPIFHPLSLSCPVQDTSHHTLGLQWEHRADLHLHPAASKLSPNVWVRHPDLGLLSKQCSQIPNLDLSVRSGICKTFLLTCSWGGNCQGGQAEI